MHTTNYQQTFIKVADDCRAVTGEVPRPRGAQKTAALAQYEMLIDNPYKYTSDDVLFQVYADKNNIHKEDLEAAREQFFSRGQACLRASPLSKRYGWGIHSDEAGRVAIYGCETPEYRRLVNAADLKVISAMRSSR